jgi:hypothetical protein
MFEELELWDSLIVCYQMLQKVPQVRSQIFMKDLHAPLLKVQ